MVIARIVGNVTAAAAHPGLKAARLLLCELLDDAGNGTGRIIGAGDWLGAGIGNTVLVDADGDACQVFLKDPKTPLRNVVAAIVDSRNYAGGARK
ncbi:MAG: EutN/CcmL family microcompartment protein [Opitutales bacterium]|nr:EutN/CcmL family microcompartment protein [Opitutales bacterium]